MGRWIDGEAGETEGAPPASALCGFSLNPFDDARQVIPDLNGRHPHHTDATLSQPYITQRLMFGLMVIGVLLTIDLNGQPGLGDVEIENVRPDRMLPTNPQTGCILPQRHPQPRLGRRQRTPHPSRAFVALSVSHRVAPSVTPLSRRATSP